MVAIILLIAGIWLVAGIALLGGWAFVKVVRDTPEFENKEEE